MFLIKSDEKGGFWGPLGGAKNPQVGSGVKNREKIPGRVGFFDLFFVVFRQNLPNSPGTAAPSIFLPF